MRSLIGIVLISLLFQQTDPETRIINYLKANAQPGKQIIVSDLFNNVFKTPEEQAVLNRLFNTFFKIPMYFVQYNMATHKIPTLQEMSEQFNFKVPGEADVILRIMETDPRVPKFLTRDPKTGEVTAIDTKAITSDPRFSTSLERTVSGWEGKPAPAFSIQTYDGKTLNSSSLMGKPYMVYIWFTNCPPCVKTSPILAELYAKYGPQGFQIIAANSDKVLQLPYDDSVRADYVKKVGIKFTTAFLNPEMQKAYGGASVFPTMFFVNKDGIVVKQTVAFQEKPAIEAAIQLAMKK